MKITSHNARVDASGLHNDRNYDVNLSPHIDQDKMVDNRYWTYSGRKDKPLNEIELDFYKEHFSEYVKMQNQKNKVAGHSERNRTIKQFYKNQNTRPEDKILQIGDKDSHVDPEVLWECALEYQKRFDEIFGGNCKIIDMSLHVDEETPHVHIRRVWIYEDEHGIERVSQTKALQEMGILAKNTEKKEGRYNNAKITFTSQERELFRNICLERGIELEPDEESKRKHLSVPEYKEMRADLDELEKKRALVQKDINEAMEQMEGLTSTCESIENFLMSPIFYHIYDDEIAEAKKKDSIKRAAIVSQLFKQEAMKITTSESSFRKAMEEAYEISKEPKLQKEINKLSHKVEILSQFIVDKGLGDELVEYTKTHKTRTNDTPHKAIT